MTTNSFRGRFVRSSAYLLTCFATAIWLSSSASAQSDNTAESENALLIVIFSPVVERSNASMGQSVVWKSFVQRLQKGGLKLSVVNEEAINPTADQARALELARDFSKHTVWLQFGAGGPTNGEGLRDNSADRERLVARYVVFAPSSNDIVSSGDVQQEVITESTFAPLSKGPTARRSGNPLPDGSTSGGPRTMDLDSLQRVGSIVAERVIKAVKRKDKGKDQVKDGS